MHETSENETEVATGFAWFLPTFHGDIELLREGATATILRAFETTPDEAVALRKLREIAIKGTLMRKPWVPSPSEFPDPEEPTYRTSEGCRVLLHAPIQHVQRILAPLLRHKRPTVNVVRFTNGEMIEISPTDDLASVRAPSDGPVALEGMVPAEPAPSPAPAPARVKPAVAATVERPVRGCPQPAFDEAEIRAANVLQRFLTEEQYADYMVRGQFVSRGIDTGRQYLLTSRERPAQLRRWGGRSLFDLTDGQPVCTHDWAVPAAEELLSLHLHLSIAGGETYLRRLVPEEHEA